MSVTVRDVLNLEIFKNARLLSGHKYLDTIVTKVTIADNPASKYDDVLSRPGDFYISSLYFARNNIKKMYSYLDSIISTKASGLCLIDEYIEEVPNEICEYCDAKHFPLIQIHKYTPYSDIISSIMELIILDQQNILLENKIDALARGFFDEIQKSKIISEINPHFQNKLSVLYCAFPENQRFQLSPLISQINSTITNFACYYNEGLLIFISYYIASPRTIQDKLAYILGVISATGFHYIAGISNHNQPLQNANIAINQALAAVESNNITGSNIINYSDLGFTRLLLLFNGHEELENFYHDMIGPIIDFDKTNHNSILMDTLICFFENDQNYKSTASILFVHENTVRHRIKKAMELASANCSNKNILEDISIALKIFKLRQNK